MKIEGTVEIAAAPEKVWAWVADPRRTPRWNPNCRSVTPLERGEPGPGWRFSVAYQLSAKPGVYEGVVVTWEPPRRVAFKLKGAPLSGAPDALESYELTPNAKGTRLAQLVTVDAAAMPFWARALVWIMQRIGAPVGRRMLEDLAELVEVGA